MQILRRFAAKAVELLQEQPDQVARGDRLQGAMKNFLPSSRDSAEWVGSEYEAGGPSEELIPSLEEGE